MPQFMVKSPDDLRRHRLTVRTLTFQGGNRGSIPRGAATISLHDCSAAS